MVKKASLLLVISLISSFAFAEVPVVDYSTDAKSVSAQPIAVKPEPELVATTSANNLNSEQRINKLEQQISNINEQNLISKIDELQQRLQKLTGQLEDQAHQIEQLNTQLRGFYQDLNQRLEKSQTSGVTPAATATTTMPITTQNANQDIVNVTSNASSKSTATVTTNTGDIVEVPSAATVAEAATEKENDVKPRTDKTFLKEQQMYQTAIDLLPDKKYEASSSKLRDYLKQYPKGAYVANAHYWLGEINFLQKNYDAAEEEFQIVVNKYAKSKRVSDAMFKLALVHQNQGRDAQARKELQQVMKRYPGMSAAHLAKLQLEGN